MRIGTGYDVHRLVEGRKLIMGGVEIPYEKGLLGHSDADVLSHAIMDALLGAAALGDIGKFFPDTDPRAAREAVTDLAKRHAGYAGIFTGTDETGYQFVIASDGADAREAASVLRREFGARGGGRSAMVQGSVQAAAAAIRAALSARGTV